MSQLTLGVDIGGSHIALGWTESGNSIVEAESFSIDNKLVPEQVVSIIQSYVEKTTPKLNSKYHNWSFKYVGICSPGHCKDGVIVATANLPLFKNVPICQLVSTALNNIPVVLVNDADAALCAEMASNSALTHVRNAALVAVGTGIGVGLMLDGKLHQGHNGLIEAGHMIIDKSNDAPLCGCGQRGCVEIFASAKNTSARLRSVYEKKGIPVTDIDAKEVCERAAAGDSDAQSVLTTTVDAISTLCINLSRVVDIEVVVIGGGFSLAGESLRLQIEKSIRMQTWNVLPTDFRVVLSSSPSHVGVLGAAIACIRACQSRGTNSSQPELSSQLQSLNNNTSIDDKSPMLKSQFNSDSNLTTLESKVEQEFLRESGLSMRYAPVEKVDSIEVENVYELGKLVSLRFLEWAIANPNGVIALPTGRTPEYFIKTMEKLKLTWKEDRTQAELIKYGFSEDSLAEFPTLSGLNFVMLDEFFPMSPLHRNSFCHYIELFYTSIMGIDSKKVLKFDLIEASVLTETEINLFNNIDVDLKLLNKDIDEIQLSAERKLQRGILLKVEQYCEQFEARVRALGGIGFFLGGIGPDGHVAFNQPGSAHDSVTRLVTFNYPTAAAAASDLGGIEKARGKAAMTIGLGTIAFNPKATVIIMAAGEGKAEVIRAALEDPVCIDRPASALHSISGARFYITHGSACKLTARKAERIAQLGEEAMEWAMNHLAGLNNRFGLDGAHMVKPSKHYSLAETCMYNASLKLRIPVHKLTLTDIESLPELRTLPTWICDPLKFHIIITCATRRLREKVGGGLKASSPTGRCFLHTAPHHDDIMLSYHAAMHQILGRQPNQVNSLSPFTPTPAAIPFAPSESPLTVRKINSYKSIQRTRSDSIQRTRSNSMVDLSQLMVQQNSSLRKGELFNENINYFAYLTSGFHSVNDAFLWKQVNAVSSITMSTNRSDDNGIDREPSFDFLMQAVIEGEISREYDDLMTEFLEAFIAKDFEWQDRLEHFIFLRKICEVWAIPTTISYPHLITRLKERVNWIRVKYLSHHQPGDAVPKEMQLLKGCMRETEVDRVWALSKMPMNRIYHMRSKFYNDDFFTPLPSLEDDAMPMANLIKSRQPDVLTVAFDPEGTGPDTHYKVLQVVAAGLRVAIERNDLANPNPIIWGYRNVWFVFEPSDATLMIPASAADLDLMHDTFMSCFTTQKAASFPSPHYDGPFSAWSRHLQKEQHSLLRCLLGDEYFLSHPDPRVRNSAGFVFLKAMDATQFLEEVEQLKSKFENTPVATAVVDE